MGRYIKTNPHPHTLTCKGWRGGKRHHDFEIHVGVHRIRPLIADKLHKLRDPAIARAVLDRWLAEPVAVKRVSMQQTIEGRLAELDAEEASLDRQARGAMRLAGSEQPGVAAEAERVLSEVNADRVALKTTREGLYAQLARLPVERSRSLEVGKLERLLFDAEGFANGWRLRRRPGHRDEGDRELLKAWVDAIGPPIFRRPIKYGKQRLAIIWPLIDAARPAPAPNYAESVPA